MKGDPRTTVPMPLVLDDENQWPAVIAQMKRIGTGRALLYVAMQPVPQNSIRNYRHRLGSAATQNPEHLALRPDLRFYDLWAELFVQRREQFQAAGIGDVGIWMGQTLGHGGSGVSGSFTQEGVRGAFQSAWDEQGRETRGVSCPLCPRLRDYLCAALARLSQVGPSLILLDDDFRVADHGTPRRGCFCPLHQAEFRRHGMSTLRIEDVAERVYVGEPGLDRTAFWKAQDASLIALASALGGAVHAASPSTRVGLCMSCRGELADHLGIIRALAGTTRPFVRTAGAPYGGMSSTYANNFESIRIQRARIKAELPEAEEVCEGDTFPHLTARCPATLFDAYLHMAYASGATGVLTYAFSYVSPLRFELGYANLLARNQPRYDAIQRLIPSDCHDLGLTIPWRQQPVRVMHVTSADFAQGSNDPHPHKLCPQLGTPSAYDDLQGPVLLVGWQAMLARDAELQAWAKRGLVLDAPAALELTRRGIPCGLVSAEPAQAPNAEHYHSHLLNGRFAGGAVALWSNAPKFYSRCSYQPKAEILTTFRAADDSEWGPGVALWEDPAGRRFAILPWDMRSPLCQTELQLMVSHARRYQWHRLLGWLGRNPLAATVDAPNAQVMVRQLPDHSRTVVTVLNGTYDPLTPVLRLDPRLGQPDTVRFLGPEGSEISDIPAVWGKDGDAVTLTLPCRLVALGFCAVSIAAGSAPGWSST